MVEERLHTIAGGGLQRDIDWFGPRDFKRVGVIREEMARSKVYGVGLETVMGLQIAIAISIPRTYDLYIDRLL